MRMLLASLLFASACSTAYADRVGAPVAPGPRTALAIAPAKLRAPYDVQVIRENGETLPTYAARDRFYVQGAMNEHYTIRVTNPTAARVEAVVSVDGLDVIDGETADLHKRGYIVPPYGDVRIEGFRTSLEDVATFRFSSVDGSYAGKQGKARNVGVIAVAIFEEQPPPPDQEIIYGGPTYGGGYKYDYRDDLANAPHHNGYRGRVANDDRPAKGSYDKKAASPPPAEATAPSGGAGRRADNYAPSTAPAPRQSFDAELGGDYEGGEIQGEAPRTGRLGLGTEFGEGRYSAASYTKFVRATNRPIAIAELRYNDAAGLMALGIPVTPIPDGNEVMLRETANPFPNNFARPPGY